MGRPIKRLLLLALIGCTALWVIRGRRRAATVPAQHAPESAWPPIRTVTTEPAVAEPAASPVVDATADWLAPDDAGACPISHPIKANDTSHIFHVPGGRFYDRTKAERCYAEADHAERDGYRRAKA
ncbi:MAG: hypothetical protein JWL72_4374 [Ilumatobacteraceae bacterium]|nr:hypothetical protein [Ilumatobacteraceae bacterium]MCU1391036.1 hypothetical protein [Ilumatobacteraceae bacterium]